MPKHSHYLNDMINTQFVYSSNRKFDSQEQVPNSEWGEKLQVNGVGYNVKNNSLDEFRLMGTNTGGSQPHTNMPPYLTVNIYVRKE